MTGFIATFGIAAAGTIVGLVIAHFSKGKTTKNPHGLTEQQRQVLDLLERMTRVRYEKSKEAALEQTGVPL